MLKIGHEVKVQDSLRGPTPPPDNEVIRVPEELEGVPGARQSPETVNFYARNYPLESHSVENYGYRSWSRAISDIKEVRDHHEKLNKPIMRASVHTGDIEPTVQSVGGKDVTKEIKDKALELGFSMTGITRYDHRYTYLSKRKWVKPFPHAICLALEQPYEETQMIPSEPAEAAVFATYRRMGELGLELGDYIRSLGYHAQIHNPGDSGSPVIPMFVEAGMGQQGANGYLLSPHFGSRHRLMIVTTDAEVTHDEPVDYGVQAFCTICQVCVNRCPGRALMREKVWWRGVEKFKIIAKRCRPVMGRYAACGVCMVVCPVQRYGLKPVLDHYAETGQVLGKGTHNLEGYEMRDLGYFGPGQLPQFDAEFFHIPDGTADQALMTEFKEKMSSGDVQEGADEDKIFLEFAAKLRGIIVKGPQSYVNEMLDEVDQDEF